jgi:hypothetical protein
VTASLSSGNFTAAGSTLLADYTLPTSASGAVGQIDPKSLTASLTGTVEKTYDGGATATLTSSNYSLAGFVSGEGATVGQTVGTYAQKDVGTGLTVTATLASGNFTATGSTQLTDYTLPTSASGNVGQIDAKAVTATLIGTVEKTYNGNVTATLTSGEYSLTGAINGDVLSLSAGSGAYGTKNAGNNLSVSFSSLALGGTNYQDYALSSATLSSANLGLIDQKVLTAALTGTVLKTYDGTNTATLSGSNYTLSGVIGADQVTLNNPASGTYSDQNVGFNKTVSVTGLALSGGAAPNYSLGGVTTASAAIGEIDPKTLTATLTGTIEKTYDGTTRAVLGQSNYTLTGVIGGDSVSLFAIGAYATQSIGTGILVTFNNPSLIGGGSGNYILGNSTLSGNVGQIDAKVLTASLTGTIEKTYDGTTTASLAGGGYTLTGVVSGETVGLNAGTGTYASQHVGTDLLVTFGGVTLTGATASNYVLSGAGLSGDVGQIDPKTVTASLTGTVEKTYDGSTTATLTSGAYSLTGFVSGEGATVAQTSGTYAQKDAGTGLLVTASLSSGNFTAKGSTQLTDYTLPTTASGSVGQIDPKALTASLTGTVEKTYDGGGAATLTSGEYSLTGFVSGEGATVGQTVGTYASTHVGTGITVTAALTSGNYTATGSTVLADYVLPTSASGAVGQIDAKSLTASLTGTVEKTYDGGTTATLTSGEYSLTGFVSGQGATVTQTSGTYAQKDAGTGLLVTASLSSGNFTATGSTQLTDYTLPTTASGNVGQIDPKALTASLTGTVEKTYDGTAAATLTSSNYSLSGFVSGEGATVTQTAATYGQTTLGTGLAVSATLGGSNYTATGSTQLADYVLPTLATGNVGEIDAKVLTASLTGTIEKTYDGTTTASLAGGGYTLSGVVSGQTVGLNAGTGTYASQHVGTGILVTFGGVTLTGATASNYVLSGAGLSGSVGQIDPKTVTASLTGTVEKTYDGSTTATLTSGAYSLTGFVSGQGATVGQTVGTYAQKDVGTGLLVTASLSSGNFTATGSTQLTDYTLPTTASGAVGQIDPKALTASLIGTVQKTYDGSTTATLTSGNYSLTGFVSGEGATVGQTVGTYASSAVGTGINVTASLSSGNYTATGSTHLADYILPTSASGAVGEIDGHALTVNLIGTVEKTYDGTTTATLTSGNYSITGFVSGNSATINQTVGSYALSSAGTGLTVTVNLSLANYVAGSGTVLADYYLPTTASGAIGVIDPKALTASLVGTVTKTYDGTTTATLGPSNYGLTGVIGGDTVTLSGTGTYTQADASTGLGVTFNSLTLGGAQSLDYRLSNSTLTGGGAGTIAQKRLTVTLTGTASKTYDDSVNIALTAANFTVSGVVGSDAVSLGNLVEGQLDTVHVGTGKTVTVSESLTGAKAGDYTLGAANMNFSGAIGTVTPATVEALLTGTVEKTYDGTTAATVPSSDFTLYGLYGSDTATVTATGPNTYQSATAGSNVRVFVTGMQLSGANAGDYQLYSTSTNAYVGKIDPKALTASLTGTVEKTYDGATTATLTAANYSLSGVIGADSVTLNDPTSGTYAQKDVGSGLGVTVTGLALSGSKAVDYTLSGSVTGAVGKIDAKTVTPGLTGTIQKTYDGTTTATLSSSNYTLSGVVSGDTVGLTGTGTYSQAGVDPGLSVTFNSLALSGAQSGDYVLSTTSATSAGGGNIVPKLLTASLTGTATKTYNDSLYITLTSANFTLAGVVGGDNVVLDNMVEGVLDTVHVGSAKLVTAAESLTGAQAADYTLGAANVNLTGNIGVVTPATVEAVLNGPVTKAYNGTASATLTGGMFSLYGLYGGDTVTLNPGTGTYASSAVGTNIRVFVTGMSITGASAGDYVLYSTTTNAYVGTIN